MENGNDRPVPDSSSASAEQTLRQRAEEIAGEKERFSAYDVQAASLEDTQRKLHELLVHQIELDMQNDELRRTQIELEESRERYVDLYDLAPVGYCTISGKGLILEINLTAANILGVPRAALIHQPFTKFILKEDQDIYYLHRQHLFKAGEQQAAELRMKKGDGTSFWAHLVANILEDSNGAVKCRVILSDITDTKNMELELRKTAEELERKDKLVTDFFINISHELKTPITLIMLALEIIESYLQQPKLNREGMIKRTAIMKQNANRLSRLVGNILDITKIDAGFMDPKFSYIDIVDLIRNIVDSMESFASKRGLQIKFSSSVEAKSMPIDSEIIERIILNLVSNAIKHTPEGGNIAVHCSDLDGKILIAVKDDGDGIPDNMKAIIFDRFRQVNTSLARSSEGSGIGLSLIKALVDLLRGRIWFDSTLGKGSEFFVELPVVQMEEKKLQVVQQGMTIDRRIEMEFSDI